MSKMHFARALGGWTALASALALLAVPAQARPYDGNEGGGRHGGAYSGQAQQQAQAGGGASQQQGGSQGNWRGRGGNNGNGGNAGNGGNWSGGSEWRARAAEQRRSQDSTSQPGQSQTVQPRWSGGGNGGRWRDRQAPSNERATSQGWNGGNGAGQTWQGRNRGYADRDRNSSYRERPVQPQAGQGDTWRGRDGWRAENRRDNREQRQTYRQGWRDGQRTETWRNRQQQDGNWRNDGRRNDRSYSGNRDSRRWDRDWRRDRRYDWNAYRSHNRDVYRIGRYYAPVHSHRYSRLGIGFFLGSAFYSSRYWIDDPWMYRLPEVYGPYRWVRYYDDALLVDVYSGEVVDVIYDFFW